MALVLLIPILRCLLVGTHMLFHRSPGIYSMTYSLFLFLCGGVSMPFLQLLSGLSLFVVFQVVCGGVVAGDSWSQSASGEALCCLHQPGGWVWWGVLREVVLWMPWSAAVWGEVGRCGCVGCRPTLDNYCRSCLGLVFYLGI